MGILHCRRAGPYCITPQSTCLMGYKCIKLDEKALNPGLSISREPVRGRQLWLWGRLLGLVGGHHYKVHSLGSWDSPTDLVNVGYLDLLLYAHQLELPCLSESLLSSQRPSQWTTVVRT